MSASINELEPIIKDNHPWNGPFSKTQKHFKTTKGKKSPSRKIETEEVRGSSDEEYQDNTFHHREIYSTSHDKR